jgi:CRP-like cAMP-binding protein
MLPRGPTNPSSFEPAHRLLRPSIAVCGCEAPVIAAKRSAPPTNRLLAMLSRTGLARVIESCDDVELDFGEVLGTFGKQVHHVYFPTASFISLITTLTDGARLEVGIIGDEGMLGSSLALGVDIEAQHALVQGAGKALRMTTETFLGHCRHDKLLRQTIHRYVYVLASQLAQTAACTHYHFVEARLARWLLMTRDRAHSNQFRLTHEFLAYMLGVRRVGITEAASALQGRGLINYSRGGIDIIDGIGLEKASCRCYRRARAMYDRTLGVGRNRGDGRA